MSVTPVRRPVFDPGEQIKQVILDRGLAPGDAIPTEAELMAALGVGRSSLREALKGLQARGIIEVRHGRGMFVGRRSFDGLVDGLVFHGRLGDDPTGLTTVSELVDVRDVLETGLVAKVALDADDDLLDELDATVVRMQEAVDRGESFQEADRHFHEQLYSRMDNALVRQLVHAFWDALDAVRPQLAVGVSDADADVDLHRRIAERVRARDPEGARAAMTEHFRGTHLWIQGERRAGGQR